MVNAPPHSVPTEVLVAIAQLVVGGAGYNRLLNETVRATALSLDADRCEVLRPSPDGESLLPVASGDKGVVQDERAAVPNGLSSVSGYALLCEAPVFSTDLNKDRRFGPDGAPHVEGPVSAVAAPVAGHEKPIGVLVAYAERAGAFDDRHAVSIARTGSLLGAALERLNELETLRSRVGGTEPNSVENLPEFSPKSDGSVLTERQFEVLTLMAEGCSAKQIASDLDLSIHTVHFHQRNLYRALNVGTSTTALKRAAELGLLRFPSPGSVNP